MEKFLYFNAAADDAVTLPLSALKSMSHNGANTVVFEFLTDDVNGNTAITITTAANKEKEFMDDVSRIIARGRDPFVEIANDEDERYASSNVGTSGSVVAAIGRDVGPRRKVVDIVGQTTVLTAADSGTIFTVNVGSNAATTITLPTITATNIGSYYEFFVNTENTGGIDILTATTDDTSGDVFFGALGIASNVADSGAVSSVITAADVNQINLTGALADSGGEVGSFVRCIAVSFSSAGHSQWQVDGTVGTDDNDNAGTALFIDRD